MCAGCQGEEVVSVKMPKRMRIDDVEDADTVSLEQLAYLMLFQWRRDYAAGTITGEPILGVVDLIDKGINAHLLDIRNTANWARFFGHIRETSARIGNGIFPIFFFFLLLKSVPKSC